MEETSTVSSSYHIFLDDIIIRINFARGSKIGLGWKYEEGWWKDENENCDDEEKSLLWFITIS